LLQQQGILVRAAEQQVQALEATVAQRDARIKSLEAVRLTKDQVEKLKEMKANAKRHEAENRTLTARLTDMRQQLAAATAAANKHRSSSSSSVKEELNSSSSSSAGVKQEASAASDNNSAAAAVAAEQAERLAQLEEVKDMLSDKLRKYVAHCKKLEGERGSIKAALEHAGVDCSHYDNLADGVSALADPQTTGSLIGSAAAASNNNNNTSSEQQQQLAAAEQRVAQLETRLRDGMTSYAELERAEAAARAAHDAVQQQLAAERTAAAAASGELRALREGARDAEERSRQLTFLEAENLQLMLEIKDVRKQCAALKAEVDALRTAAAAAAAVASPPAATSASASSGKALASLPVNSAGAVEQSADASVVSKATANSATTAASGAGNVSGVFDKENSANTSSAAAAVSKRGKARALIEQPVEDCPEGDCKQS
jgi:chromosome segregation ATPase